MEDHAVEARLFRRGGPVRAPLSRAHRFSMGAPGIAEKRCLLTLLWNEYVEASHQGPTMGMAPYGYSQFCDLFARYQGQVDLTMRQEHRAGEKVFIDYSGKKPRFHDMATGEVIEVDLFVGVLGASNFTFAEATRTQTKPDFCASTVRMFEYFGATPIVVVPDQLRSAVKGPDRYDPEINPTYADLARHYQVAIVPARAREPRDKAKVEGGVRIAQRWILACLRNRAFFGLEELNAAIGELLVKLNNRPFQKLEGCRRSAFESIDRPAMNLTQMQFLGREISVGGIMLIKPPHRRIAEQHASASIRLQPVLVRIDHDRIGLIHRRVGPPCRFLQRIGNQPEVPAIRRIHVHTRTVTPRQHHNLVQRIDRAHRRRAQRRHHRAHVALAQLVFERIQSHAPAPIGRDARVLEL